MPASPQSSGTAGSIVLVEEYGALAVAIGSALKKFAPGFATRTVCSLAEAEGAVAELRPDLLVLDYDPPQPGALEFFTRTKASAPSARAVVIAAAAVSEFGSAGAVHFVEKPFDLATFGAGVQAALGSANGGRRSPTIRDLSLRDVIPLQCIAGLTAVVKVDASEGRSGEIHFTNGQISHAETTETEGVEALREMLAWRAPRFKQPKRKPRAARTIEGNWSTVLAEALSSVRVTPQQGAEAEPLEQKRETVGGGKKIVVIDDTEMLLVFVDDILATADPTLEITTAATGSDGVDRVAAVKPDLVLLDYSLPDFNGDEVAQRLLASPATAAIPIIMMSGHVPEMAASALRCENIVATLAKPFLSDALVDVVTRALANPAEFAVRAAPSSGSVSAAAPLAQQASTAPQPQGPASGNGHRHSQTPPALEPEPAPVSAKPPSPPLPPITAPAPPAPQPAVAAAPPAAQSTAVATALAPPPPPAVQPTQAAAPSATTSTAVAPPPPAATPMIVPPQKAPAQPSTATVATRKPVSVISAPSPLAMPLVTAAAPARIAAAPTNAVVLSIALEVLAIQFSPALQMAAIRARPASRTISLHVAPGAVPAISLPEAGFELGPVNLDTRGQIDTIRLLPTTQRLGAIEPRNAFPVGGVALLPSSGGKAVELTPSAAAPMMMNLSAPFELAGVELSPTFGVGALVLKARGGEIRVSLERDGGRSGALFETAQVLLNRSAQIAEILLDAVA